MLHGVEEYALYQNLSIAFVIDESHCIKKWYVASHELGWVAQGQIQGEGPGGQDPTSPSFLSNLWHVAKVLISM